MNWTAKLDQQQDALLTTFYMFIMMTLMVIRAGLDARNAPAGSLFVLLEDDTPSPFPLASQQGDRPTGDYAQSSKPPPSALNDYLDRLYADALALLYAAEMVARRLASMGREIYELMKQADALAQFLRDCSGKTADQCEFAPALVDTS